MSRLQGPTTRLTTTRDAARDLEFVSLYRAGLSFVWGLCRRLGVPERDREDVAQTVFLRVHRQLEQYDRARPLKPWLFGITFRVVSEHRRASMRLVPEAEMDDNVCGRDGVDVLCEQRESREVLLRALASLPIERRAIVVGHLLEDIPMPALAVTLGIPLGTAYSRLRLARRDLAAFLGERTDGLDVLEGAAPAREEPASLCCRR